MRILGADLVRELPAGRPAEHTLVLLDTEGAVEGFEHAGTLPEVAAAVGRLAAGDPFLLGVNIPVVVPAKAARSRPLENLVRRRFGHKLPPGGRTALAADPLGVAGESLLAGLATAGTPCLPYPDRDRRQSGLAETYPGLALKALLWETSPLAESVDAARGEELFRALSPPDYRAAKLPARSGWADQVAALDLLLRLVGRKDGYDLGPVAETLAKTGTARDAERAAALFDATLIASTARRYLVAPENCLFLGDRESGYTILPADSFIRRLALTDAKPRAGELFPQDSLRKRLGAAARVRSLDLLSVPGRPQRLEARFSDPPSYEFDNVDEMMWWKHCRHVSGARLPVEGLVELVVRLADSGEAAPSLRLVRSRHRTLSFRFDPPEAWRAHVPTRDGRTYSFGILRAVYETLPTEG